VKSHEGWHGIKVTQTTGYEPYGVRVYWVTDLNRDESHIEGELRDGTILDSAEVFRRFALTSNPSPMVLAERHEWAHGSGSSKTRQSKVLTAAPEVGTETDGRMFAPPDIHNHLLTYSLFYESRIQKPEYGREFVDLITGLGSPSAYSLLTREEEASWGVVGDALRDMVDDKPLTRPADVWPIAVHAKTPTLRYFALMLLRGTMPTSEMLEVSATLLRDQDALVRVGAAEGMWIWNTQGSRDAVRAAAKIEQDPRAREEFRALMR